jgi:hypothetical protein
MYDAPPSLPFVQQGVQCDSQDYDEGISVWQANRVPAHKRAVRVHEKYNYIKPGNYKDANSFFVTSEMIENPSNSLFRGKHDFIGELLAKRYVAHSVNNWKPFR